MFGSPTKETLSPALKGEESRVAQDGAVLFLRLSAGI